MVIYSIHISVNVYNATFSYYSIDDQMTLIFYQHLLLLLLDLRIPTHQGQIMKKKKKKSVCWGRL